MTEQNLQRLHRVPRLYHSNDLTPNCVIELPRNQAHYIATVMRLKTGDKIRLFNGSAGEWLGEITTSTKRAVSLRLTEQLRLACPPPDIDYLFAPLKSARLDYLVQKATEMGVRRLRPVHTQHTISSKINQTRMAANIIEAAEQCNLVALPELCPLLSLDQVLRDWSPERRLIFCDEAAPIKNPLEALAGIAPGPLAVLIGPEGGFSDTERALLLSLPFVAAISLGPRIMRADTAAVAALSLVQANCGDWGRQ